MTLASNKLAKAQEVAALKGLRAAVPFYLEATDALAEESRYDAAVGVLAEVLNAREKKRSLFGSKEVNPLGPDRLTVAKQFAKLTREGQVNDSLLELLSALALENPDDPDIRLANAEGLYRAGYMADAIDEFRYCEKLIPDDGALVARLGELYAIMSRNGEAVEHLRQGIGELMQAHQFDDVPFFAAKLIEVDAQAANDVQRWISSLPEDALGKSREQVSHLLDIVREKGLDDGRWSSIEQRLDGLSPKQQTSGFIQIVSAPAAQLAEEPAAPAPQAPQETASEQEAQAEPDQPVWGSQTAPVSTRHIAWDDVSSVEPASEDEMRMLLGPSAQDAPADPATTMPSANGVHVAQSRPATTPKPTVAALPPGLAAFTRRKADAAFTAGDFAGAAQSFERLLKGGFDAEIAAPLLECYLGTERYAEAASLGLQLADHQADSGQLEKAVATLALILEHTADPEVARRHNELATAK